MTYCFFSSPDSYDIDQEVSIIRQKRFPIENECGTSLSSENSSTKYENNQSDSEFERYQKEHYLGWCLNDDYEAQQNSFNHGITPINNSPVTSSHLLSTFQCSNDSTDILSKTSKEDLLPYSFSFSSDSDRNRNMFLCHSSTFEFEPDLRPSSIRTIPSLGDLDLIPSTQPTLIRYGEYLASLKETKDDY